MKTIDKHQWLSFYSWINSGIECFIFFEFMDFSVTVSPFIHDEAMENVTFNNSRGIRIDLPVSRMHLHLEYCLMGGQAFHWVLTGIKQWYLCTYILAISVILNLIISINTKNIFFSFFKTNWALFIFFRIKWWLINKIII